MKKEMKVTYKSTNSGGGWWLKDKDWVNLEKAGWTVEWGGVYFCTGKRGKKICDKEERKNCPGHRKYESFNEITEQNRWLGAASTTASKDFLSIKDALDEFETITKQDVSDEGCNCCGPPHSFEWDGNYASGNDLLEYLYNSPRRSLRDMYELLKSEGE